MLDYFRQVEFRQVKKDRTVRLMGSIFEVPVGLIDRKVELRFHPEDLSDIEIFFQGKSYGTAVVVNPHVNAMIGRNWDSRSEPVKEDQLEGTIDPPTGKLFGGGE